MAGVAREEAIRLENVSKTFETASGSVEAVSGINLSVKSGEFFTIIGPSGCGKSSILSMIAGLLRPTSGKVIVKGEQLVGPRPSLLAIMFQEPGLLPWRNVQKNVELGLEAKKGMSKNERSGIAMKYIEMVGLSGFRDKYPHQLSGGMKQRVALGRSLSLNTEILLLDEPFGALDEQTRLLMGNELLEIARKTSKTVLLVTHSIQEAVNLSDRIIVLSHRPGRIKKEIPIDLGHPRKTTETAPYVDEVWSLIRE